MVAWWSGALVGLVAGFMRGWVPFAFLLAGMGFGGTLAIVIGPGLIRFVSSESGQAAAGFFLVFFLVLLLGALVTYALRGPLTMASSLTVLFPMGFLLNRLGGLLVGVLFPCILLSVILIGLQQIPVVAIAKGIEDSSFASGPISWVDRFVASIELSTDWKEL